MDIERWDGTKERKEFKTTQAMMYAVLGLYRDPSVKTLTLHFPKRTIPSRKNKPK